jgi:hypothetical protein
MQPGLFTDGVPVIEVEPGSTAAWNDIQPGDVLTKVEEFNASTVPQLASILKTLGEGYRGPKKVDVDFFRKTSFNNGFGIKVQFQLSPASSDTSKSGQSDQPTGELSAQSPVVEQKPTQTKIYKGKLRYNGKSFDEWRNSWQTELSHEKRIEAVRALAAFGANGFGKEASQAILDVAGEYDFSVIENDIEGGLKQAILRTLNPGANKPSLAKYWVPDLAERINKDPSKWKWLTFHLFKSLTTDDEAVLATLQSLAENGPAEVKTFALDAMVRSIMARNGGPEFDDKTRAVVSRALQSKDAATIKQTIPILVYYPQPGGDVPFAGHLVFMPEVVSLLFHADESVKQNMRSYLGFLEEKDAAPLAKSLLEILQDKSRERGHIDAIRALASFGGRHAETLKKLGANKELTAVCKRTAERQTLMAAVVALANLTGDDAQRGFLSAEELVPLTDGATAAELEAIYKKIGQRSSQYVEAYENEEKAIYPPVEKNNTGGTAGGGGFF